MFLFDTQDYKGLESRLKTEQHTLEKTELLKFAKLATEVRQRYLDAANR